MREVIEASPRSDEHPQAQRTPLQPRMATIIEAVAETFHVDSDEALTPFSHFSVLKEKRGFDPFLVTTLS